MNDDHEKRSNDDELTMNMLGTTSEPAPVEPSRPHRRKRGRRRAKTPDVRIRGGFLSA